MPKEAPPADTPAPKPPEQLVLSLAALIRDDRLRYRVRLPYIDDDSPAVERYADAMEEYGGWGEFPAILAVQLTEAHKGEIDLPNGKRQRVRYPAGEFVLVGGFTRCAAADRRGIVDVPAVVHAGTWEDARRMAWAENSRHGRPRTRDDLKAVVLSIRYEHPELSYREVAELARTDKNAVWRIVTDLEKEEKDAELERAKGRKPAPCETERPEEAILASRPVSTSQPRHVERDFYGRPIPHMGRLQERFAAVPKAIRVTKSIREEIVTLAAMKHGAEGAEECLTPGLADLDVNAIAMKVLALMDEVNDGLPWIVCPKLEFKIGDLFPTHDDCDLCGGKGTLTKVQAERLPPALEKKASRWMGDRSGDREGGEL